MSFLFPLYFIGAAAVIIPVLLHLRRRPPQDVVPFSAVRFLEAAPVPPVKRRKLEDLLLLALRCLALMLLALMFSRPLWATRDFSRNTARARVILLDASGSMRRDDIRAQMASKLDAALAEVRETDDVALVAFDREPHLVLNVESWRALPQGQRKDSLRQQAMAIEPGWAGTDLGRALVFAAGLLDFSGGGDEAVPHERGITLISDLQEGASLDALGNFAWPQEIVVKPFVIQPRVAANFTLSPAARLSDEDAEPPMTGAAAAPVQGVRVRVSNSSGSQTGKFSLAWKGSAAQRMEGNVVPGGSRVIVVAPPEGVVDSVLELAGDAVAFDNQVFFTRAASRTVRVLFVAEALSRTDPASPLFFFSRAMKPGAGLEPMIVEKTPRGLTAQDIGQAELVVLASPLPDGMIEPLRQWLAKGHTVLCSMAAGDRGASLAKLTGVNGLSFVESAAGGYAMMGEIQFAHPLLQTFADANVRDFSKIRFWKHRVMEPADKSRIRELAAFDDRSAAIFEAPVGEGRVVAFTFGWTAAESQLAVSSKFLPLIYSLLEYAGLAAMRDGGLVVGDAIPIEAAQRHAALPVMRPGGGRVAWNAQEQPDFTATDAPGIYHIGEGETARHYAVNLAPQEGRITPMNLARLRDLGLRFTDGATFAPGHTMDSPIALEDSRREQRQKLWKIIAATALVVLLLETLVAGLRRRAPAEAAAA